MAMSNTFPSKRTIIKETVPSVYLTEERSIRIYLPPGYDENKQYPTIYCQDGEQFFNFGRIATTATSLIHENQLEPFIIVGIDVDISRRTEEYSPEGQLFQHYCSFVAMELVTFVENRVSSNSDSASRLLAGDSLGATVSLHLALDYPLLFHRVLSFSGAFLPSTRTRIEQEHDLSGLDLYMLVGLQETGVVTSRGTFDFLAHNRLTLDTLLANHANVDYYERDGVHTWGFWQQYMAHALQHFF